MQGSLAAPRGNVVAGDKRVKHFVKVILEFLSDIPDDRQTGRQHLPRSTLDQAARRAAFAEDEIEGKDRMAGPSCWSKAVDFAVLIALRRQP